MMNTKRSVKVALIIMGILIIFGLANSVLALSTGNDNVICCGTAIAAQIFMALYGFVLYKKPHGNMLKYAILFLAAAVILNAAECLVKGFNRPYIDIIRLFLSGMLCYVAGRLNRIEQNKYILIFCTVAMFVLNLLAVLVSVDRYNSVLILSRFFWAPVIMVVLIIAYLTRYEAHREAGLSDTGKIS